jgi:hypothetical protein
MKIFYYFRELNTPMYWWQRTHFFSELEQTNFAQIISFNPLNFETVEEANDKLIPAIKQEDDVDIWLHKSTIERIKELGIPTILVCWDNLELPYKHKAIAKSFDLVWLTSIETQYLFEEWGCKNIIFQTYAANPFAFTPNWKQPNPSIGFIGSPYGSRVNKLNDLLANKIPCSIYSHSLFKKNYNTSTGNKSIDIIDTLVKASRYMRFPIGQKVFYSTIQNKLKKKNRLDTGSPFLIKKPSVSDEEMSHLYSNFSLSLNITELRDTYVLKKPIHKIHLRAFEIPMCGGLQLASYNEEIASYFEEDKEIVLYRSKEEMIEKSRFYLDEKNDSIVIKMKQAARKRAQKEHTWVNRFRHAIDHL